jgi:hypothetical protein
MRTNNKAGHIMICVMFLCSLAFLFISCKKNDVVDASAENTKPFTGISQVDSAGRVISVDPDDWRSISSVGIMFFSGALIQIHAISIFQLNGLFLLKIQL